MRTPHHKQKPAGLSPAGFDISEADQEIPVHPWKSQIDNLQI
jgi:hypothetical protein